MNKKHLQPINVTEMASITGGNRLAGALTKLAFCGGYKFGAWLYEKASGEKHPAPNAGGFCGTRSAY